MKYNLKYATASEHTNDIFACYILREQPKHCLTISTDIFSYATDFHSQLLSDYGNLGRPSLSNSSRTLIYHKKDN